MEVLFMTFIIYSIVGWLWESIFCSIKAKHFVYRGFLLGPYCPVYGFGISAVLLLVPDKSASLLNLYFNAVVIVTVIEYITSWLLEKLFKMKLWDYTNVPLNLNGRVAIPVSLFWGLGCVLLIKVINPVVQQEIQHFIEQTHKIGPVLLFLLFAVDVISTFIFTMTTKKEVSAAIDTSDAENAGVKEFRWKHLLDNRKPSVNRTKILGKLRERPMNLKHHNLNRILKNYPNVTLKK